MRPLVLVLVLVPVLSWLILPACQASADDALRDDASRAIRRAVAYFREHVTTEGGYVFRYSDDLARREGEEPPGPPPPGSSPRHPRRRHGLPVGAMRPPVTRITSMPPGRPPWPWSAASSAPAAGTTSSSSTPGTGALLPTASSPSGREDPQHHHARRQQDPVRRPVADARRPRTRFRGPDHPRGDPVRPRPPRRRPVSQRRLAPAVRRVPRPRAVPGQAGQLPRVVVPHLPRREV